MATGEGEACVAPAEREEAALHSSNYSYAPLPTSENTGATTMTTQGSSLGSLSQLFPIPST